MFLKVPVPSKWVWALISEWRRGQCYTNFHSPTQIVKIRRHPVLYVSFLNLWVRYTFLRDLPFTYTANTLSKYTPANTNI
jgi:hypothetical protein